MKTPSISVWIVGTNDFDDGLIIKGIYASRERAISAWRKMKDELLEELKDTQLFYKERGSAFYDPKKSDVVVSVLSSDIYPCEWPKGVRHPLGMPIINLETVDMRL